MLNVIEGKEAFGLKDLDRRLDHFATNIHSLDKDIGKVSKDSTEERAECQNFLHEQVLALLKSTVKEHQVRDEFSFEIKPSLKIQDDDNLANLFLYDITREQNIIPLFKVAESMVPGRRRYKTFYDPSDIPNSCLLKILTKRKYIPTSELILTVIPTRYVVYLNSISLIWMFDFDNEREFLPDTNLITSRFKSGSVSYKDWTKREIEDFFVESFKVFLNEVEHETERRRKIIAERQKK